VLGNQEEERSVHFQGRKISKGMLIFVVADIWNCYNMDMKKANWNLWRKDKMDRPITTLFMLMSVDGKISTGATDDLDVDKDFPKIKGVNEGLHQYYEIEQTTDLWSFNSGRVQEKMGVNKKKIPRKTPVSFVVIDNKHLNENGIRYFCALSKEFVLITTNTRHPAFNVEDENLHIIYQNELSLKDALIKLKSEYGCERITIQTGGTLNNLFLREKLFDYVDIIIAPVLIGGKDTSTLIDGKSLTEECELSKLGVVKLQECVVLENSYLRLRYEVIH
jgi:2,5-diamino-6-(ribosylamino)-4(3H)-pyrimidinone 5'-phosphate reductase